MLDVVRSMHAVRLSRREGSRRRPYVTTAVTLRLNRFGRFDKELSLTHCVLRESFPEGRHRSFRAFREFSARVLCTFGFGVAQENVEAVDEVRAVEGIASDSDAQ